MAAESTVKLTVQLPASLYKRLEEAARRRQTRKGSLVVEVLRGSPLLKEEIHGMRADIGLAEFIGIFSTPEPTDASKVNEQISRILEQKKSEGRL
jgi:hypothetical protein